MNLTRSRTTLCTGSNLVAARRPLPVGSAPVAGIVLGLDHVVLFSDVELDTLKDPGWGISMRRRRRFIPRAGTASSNTSTSDDSSTRPTRRDGDALTQVRGGGRALLDGTHRSGD